MKDIAGAMVLLYRSPAPALNEWKRVAAGAHMNQALDCCRFRGRHPKLIASAARTAWG